MLYVTPAVFQTAEVLGHFFAHHCLAGAGLEEESEERIAFGFGFLGLTNGNPLLVLIAVFIFFAAGAERKAGSAS